MRLFLENDYETMSQKAAVLIMEELQKFLDAKDKVVFVPSAGGTPTRLFQILTEHKNELNWARVALFQMDDYVGLSPQHPNSLANYLLKHIITPLEIKEYYLLNDANGQLLRQGPEYETLIKERGGVDIFVHGIGENGHLGFNEPGEPFDSTTRQVRLTESTINANSRFFDKKNAIPQYGITMGLSTIFSANTNFVLASGEKKRDAISRLVSGKKNPQTPASILSNHQNTIVLVDRAAASSKVIGKVSE